jgi:hypothetical protein
MRCPGSVNAESTLPDQTSSHAAEGTVAHLLGGDELQDKATARSRLGEKITIDGFTFEVTEAMVDFVEDYVALARQYAEGGHLMAEKKVNFSTFVGVDGSTGTSDAIILHPNRITVIDLKYGMGVKVDAENNEQMQLYALGALYGYDVVGDFDEIVMVIHQPRLNHVSEWSISREQLLAFGEDARLAAVAALEHESPRLEPGEKQCRWCRAKATCPALREEISNTVGGIATVADFADLAVVDTAPLAAAMSRVELVEHWCKAIRAEVERRLLNSEPVPGFKLVEGRKGNRAWTNEKTVEELMKKLKMTRDQMYDMKVISPTTAEKVLKIAPRKWEMISRLIKRADGKPSVAPATDKRPEMVVSNAKDELLRIAADCKEEE